MLAIHERMKPTITTQKTELHAGDTVNATRENDAISAVLHPRNAPLVFQISPAMLPKNSAIELRTAAPNSIGSHMDPAPAVTQVLHHPLPPVVPPKSTYRKNRLATNRKPLGHPLFFDFAVDLSFRGIISQYNIIVKIFKPIAYCTILCYKIWFSAKME